VSGARKTVGLAPAAALILALTACGPGPTGVVTTTPPPTHAPAPTSGSPTASPTLTPTPSPTPAADPVLLAAGDIAQCSQEGDEATAAILAQHPDATVQTLGDNAYNSGTPRQFGCFDDSWGVALDRMHPALGGHDYMTEGAAGYFDYFKEALAPFAPTGTDPTQGWYAYDLGAWRIIVLNSICQHIGGCDADSPQVAWLKAEIQAHPTRCSLAVIHNPRFSSGRKGNKAEVQPLWDALQAGGVELVLSGDNHAYERLAPMTPTGKKSPSGIRQFVVGTGGTSLRPFGEVRANSRVRDSATHGVLKLTLHEADYDWAFVPIDGQTFRDSGHGTCADAAPQPAA
jgi:acid phosphatase type 7